MTRGIGKYTLWLTVLLWMFVESLSDNVWGYPGQGYYIEVEIGSPPQKLTAVCDVLWREVNLKLHLCPEARQGANSAFARGSGKLDENLIEMGVIDPEAELNVLLDTGSANLAVAAAPLSNVEKFFQSNISKTYEATGQSVSVTYTQGTWHGMLGSDLVQVPSVHASQVRCDIALIQESEDFFTNGSKWQGIMGLGYGVLAQPRGTTTSWLTAISPSAFALQLGCSSEENSMEVHGVLEILHPPFPKPPFCATIIREWFYEVIVTGVWVDDVAVNIPCEEFNNDKSIVDSGTTNLRFPRKVFQEVVKMINNSVKSHGINISDAFWNQESVACLDTKPETIFPSLALGLARDDGQYFKVILDPQSYLHRDLENHSQFNCHQLALEPSDTGTVLGLVFLEGLKVIFDRTSRSVCFSSSSCGGPPVLLEGPFACDNDPMNCVHRDDVASALTAISVTMGAFLSVAAIIVAYLACSRFLHPYLCPVKSQWPRRSRSRRELLPRSSDLDLTTAT